VAALWPERVSGLVSADGYNIQDIAAAGQPLSPEQERRFWYQHYFNADRGPAGLTLHRDALCRLLWQEWSPTWPVDDATFARTAAAFDNPDFVDVVIHSYRHRYGRVAGDPAYDEIEQRLAAQPTISVPSIVLYGGDDGVGPPPAIGDPDGDIAQFLYLVDEQIVPGVGHNLPQEAPGAVVAAVRTLAAL
jgi:pimeloyl-ACP methyl ester carboxylesterase